MFLKTNLGYLTQIALRNMQLLVQIDPEQAESLCELTSTLLIYGDCFSFTSQ